HGEPMEGSLINDAFFSRLETLSLNLRTNLSGYFGGKHLVSTYGQTVEFADFREYQLGDDIRRIDWNLYSRFEKYYMRLFTDERQMQIQIFLDTSASMGRDNPKKAAYATAVAAAMGFLAVHNMDKLSLNIMNGTSCENPYGTIVGKDAFFRAIGGYENAVFDGECDINKCVTSCPDTGAGSGLSVIVSDFFDDRDWKKAVDYLSYMKRQILLVQVLSPEEADPSYDGRIHLIDMETSDINDERNMKLRITRAMLMSYKEALKDHIESIRRYCARVGADFITLRTDTPIERAFFGELLMTGMAK
ncbi:MAG: DUF58 domain-containing protein, partial [Bacteroidales bacterium]|nr:DUF58 domain-containing protein [Bacteroidales bacterium]